ncbi:hypothetical protein E1B28_011260 [Marasmius oreades]|uniref:DUF155 domain-containing protein n=1 Tax=Marasmius oreades TaxID=181124 RepID=A0A9P7RV35_9AGAR|nr:uncharacterized protein E1B28_011260 [Marasmius oreades]KAG7089593.1 hypothetical protein E1B28_011260 [Marasmius oreades]
MQYSKSLLRGLTTLERYTCSIYHAQRILSSRYFRTTSACSTSRKDVDADPDSLRAKPKAKTNLRRTASASLPIRSNPTPTRGEIQTVFTLTTSQRYLLSRLRGLPNPPEHSRILHESWWVPAWGPDGKKKKGEVFVFGNGSFVCWGLEEEDAKKFGSQVLGRVPEFQVAPLKVPETEELEFVTDPSQETRLQGDLIILGKTSSPSSEDILPTQLPPTALPQETLLARYAFSQALSRSTALSALEVSLNDYLSSMASLPHSLEETSKPGMGRKQLIMKLGQLMKFRQGLNLNKENFSDVPDFYWEEPELERHFKAMSDALEVNHRTDSVNDKITYAAEVQSVLRQLLTESSTHRMELVIIALIAVEVVIALIRDGPELWDMVQGKPSEV